MLGLIPIHDDNPTRRPAVVNWTLIAINVVVFFISPISPIDVGGDANTPAGFCRQLAFFREWAAIPVELVENDPLDVTAGPPSGDRCVAVRPDYHKIPALSVLSAMFLHGGLLHLVGNMLFLFVFGNNVEDRLGRVRYLLFYLACGYLATYGFALADPTSEQTLVGASGAIAGVLGAYLVLFPRARVTSLVPFLFFIPVWLPAWVVLGSWFVLQWLYFQGAATAEGAGVAYLAHVVGFAAGVVLIILFGGLRARRPATPAAPGTTSSASRRRAPRTSGGSWSGAERNPRRPRNPSAAARGGDPAQAGGAGLDAGGGDQPGADQAAAPGLLDHRPVQQAECPGGADGGRADDPLLVDRHHPQRLAGLGDRRPAGRRRRPARPGLQETGGGGLVGRGGGADDRAGRVEQPADVGQEMVGGAGQVGQVGQPGHAAEDQGGRPAEPVGAVQVGVGPVADHQVRAGADGRRGGVEQGPLRLAGDLGPDAGRRPQQGQGRPGARPDPLGGREGGVRVAADEPGPGPDGQGRVPDPAVGQLRVEPDGHHLGLAPRRPVDQPRPGRLQRLPQPGAADHQDPDARPGRHAPRAAAPPPGRRSAPRPRRP